MRDRLRASQLGSQPGLNCSQPPLSTPPIPPMAVETPPVERAVLNHLLDAQDRIKVASRYLEIGLPGDALAHLTGRPRPPMRGRTMPPPLADDTAAMATGTDAQRGPSL